jgi:hypothetical protein
MRPKVSESTMLSPSARAQARAGHSLRRLVLLGMLAAAPGLAPQQASADAPRTAELKLPGDTQARTVVYRAKGKDAVIEGDVIIGQVNAQGVLAPASNNVGISSITVVEGMLWKDGVIPYLIEGNWGTSQRLMEDRVRAAIAHWEANTPLRFVRYNKAVHPRYVAIVEAEPEVCRATIGSLSGLNLMRLSTSCVERTVIHEFGHVAGLHHEQSRSDRDEWIKIHWQNINPDYYDQFCRRNGGPFDAVESLYCNGVPEVAVERGYAYDYDSVMHYESRAFVRKELAPTAITIERLKPGNIDDNRVLSAGDIATLQRLYAFSSSSRGMEFCSQSRDEVCMTGDFNRDGHQDLISFHHGAFDGSSDVWVSLSNQNGLYLAPTRWATGFCGRTEEVCKVGDFNGDGADDIVSFHHGAFGGSSSVYAYLSDGRASFVYPGSTWASGFCGRSEEVCDVGDFNRDGVDDIITFHHGAFGGSANVFVYLSNKSAFVYPGKPWKTAFCYAGMTCRVGDVDGDLREDAIAFFRNVYSNASANDVWVSRSTGSDFGQETKWHENLCGAEDLCLVGDVTGDGRADAVSLVGRLANSGGLAVRAQIAISRSAAFEAAPIQGEARCGIQSNCGLADLDKDGRDDVYGFVKRGNALWISRSQLSD